MDRPRPAAPSPPGVNLVGYVTGALGLGVSARTTLAMLAASGRPFTAVDVDPGGGRQGADLSWQHALAEPPATPHAVNWFHLNPPEIVALVASRPSWLDPRARTNVCVPFWELPRLPVADGWIDCLGAMDLVLAPSRFILDAIRASAPRVRAVHYPQTVVLPSGVAARRADFGLPSDAVLFHVLADASSDLERKNPLAAIRAFRAAFPSGEPVGLVIKLGKPRTPRAMADQAALVAAAAGSPGIHVVERDLDYATAMSLAASCDVCLSLHRAEGLGLGMLEAMTLGKPVIATAWSGNMDFTTADTACLVGYDLVPVRGRHPAYRSEAIGPGQLWAEPREGEAVAWMRSLAADAALRAELGERGRRAAAARREQVFSGHILADVERVAAEAPHGGGRRLAAIGGGDTAWSRLQRLLRRITAGGDRRRG